MKRILGLVFILALAVGCGKTEKSYTPDYKGLIDQNTARIELLEINDVLQDLRLDTVESLISDLDIRVEDNEDAIDDLEGDVLNLFARTNYLAAGLVYLYNDLHYHVRQLEAADRANRRLIRSQVRNLRRQLSREIRERQLADADLQRQIDALDNDLSRFEFRQGIYNFLVANAIGNINTRISNLTTDIQKKLDAIDARVTVNEGDITTIKGEITTLQTTVTSLQSQIDALSSTITEVIELCADGGEVLLKTADEKFISYFESGSNSYLKVLDENVGYQTTDGEGCSFSIVNGEVQ